MSDVRSNTGRRRVVITTRLFDDAATRYLEAHGCEVVPSGLPSDALDTHIPDARLAELLDGSAGWIVGQRAVTEDVLKAFPDLKVIARRGVGVDKVNVEAARALGRVVTIAAGANDVSVADHTLALMLALARRLSESQARMQAGDWRVLAGTDLTEKTVGLVGFGRIARAVARRVRGFDAQILVATPRPDPEAEGVRFVDLATLLRESDHVSLHLPLGPATRHLIDSAALAQMKPSAFLINTARGGLIDEDALLAALRSGQIAGAGLDVFEAEIDPAFRPVADALLSEPNVVATPHAAGSSAEALARGNLISAQCVVSVLDGGDPPSGCVVADGRVRP